jgi:hypothetical protein
MPAVRAIESTPVSGVLTRNDVVAPGEAPSLLRDIAAGITPQEQRGSGTPRRAALAELAAPGLPRCLEIRSLRRKTWRRPAMNRPRMSEGATSRVTIHAS